MSHFVENYWVRHGNRWDNRLITRFPPEPNGHLHLGHAKAIALNFGLAKAHAGHCHLRLDDTNPAKEDGSYAVGITEMVRWLGFAWDGPIRHASDHFGVMFKAAMALIAHGLAYVDEADAETVRRRRGTLTEPGVASPDRDKPVGHHLEKFKGMRRGDYPDGSCTLRAKIDMASPNINLRDPVIYRIKHVPHDRTGATWCVYPAYDFAHPFCDAMEGISLSLCTLEFEDHKPLYEWVIAHCAPFFADSGAGAPPEELEFARLVLDRGLTSKREVNRLVDSGSLDGWDDPRLVTLLGLRRRGFTSSSVLAFCDRIGISRANSVVPFEWLEDVFRLELDPVALRRMIVAAPITLDVMDGGEAREVWAPHHPKDVTLGERPFAVSSAWWVAEEDIRATGKAEPGFNRVTPGAVIRLMHGEVVRITEVDVDEGGRVVHVKACRAPTEKPSATIHGVDRFTARPLVVDEIDTLPDAATDPATCRIKMAAMAEPALWTDAPGTRVHAMRYGYGWWDPSPMAGELPTWIRTVGMKSSFPRNAGTGLR